MIDAVLARARGAPLEANELLQKLRVIEELGLLGVHERQEVAIEIRLRLRGSFISYAARLEGLFDPFADIAITEDAIDAIALEQVGKFSDDIIGRDTLVRQIASATYALLVKGRLELVDTRIVRGHGLAEAAARKDPGLVLLGQVVGSVTALR